MKRMVHPTAKISGLPNPVFYADTFMPNINVFDLVPCRLIHKRIGEILIISKQKYEPSESIYLVYLHPQDICGPDFLVPLN
jgi:hypothetical protein